MASIQITTPSTSSGAPQQQQSGGGGVGQAQGGPQGQGQQGPVQPPPTIMIPQHHVSAPPKIFDLMNYVNNYIGHTKITRLIFIGSSCKELEIEAYRAALEEIKKTQSTQAYREVAEKLFEKDPSFSIDKAWLDATEKKAIATQERLDVELNGFRANLVKRSIRKGHNALGHHHYDRWDLNTALKCYVRTRDYCDKSKHILQMCLNVIKVSIEVGNFGHVLNYVSKAEQTSEQDPVTTSKLRVCSALANLDARKYKNAARKFLEVGPELAANFTEVISPQDIAIYGGLLALSSLDRSELKRKVLDNPHFKTYMELVPEIQKLIQDFYNSHYGACLTYLQYLKPYLDLDFHLYDHVSSIYEKIRSKAIIQYFSPFITVNLTTMAEAFNTTVPLLEKELSRLIMDKQISARIDSHNKILYARSADQRTATFERSLATGEDYVVNTKALLLRVNLMRNDFYVKPPRASEEDQKRQS